MIFTLVLLISSALCLGYGLFKYLGKKVAVFSILIVGAIGCFMLGHMYEFCMILITDEVPSEFNIGMLARIGGFAFLFSASYAQMDGLVDDRSREMLRYRLLALLGPLVCVLLFVPVVFSDISVLEKITTGAVYASAALASYYNLKHLIIPDVSAGIIAQIRTYCAFALVSSISYCARMTAEKTGLLTVSSILSVVLALTYPAVIISMERGRKKWIA